MGYIILSTCLLKVPEIMKLVGEMHSIKAVGDVSICK